MNNNIPPNLAIAIAAATKMAQINNNDMRNNKTLPPTPQQTSTSSTSTTPINCANKLSKGGPRGGIYDPFPSKLHRMLDEIASEGLDHIVGWMPHGRSIKIHKPKEFADLIMHRYFNQSKYTSFQRQLNLYGKYYLYMHINLCDVFIRCVSFILIISDPYSASLFPSKL